MPIDTTTLPGSWFDRLLKRLAERRDGYDLLDAYYSGAQSIPVGADKAIAHSYRRLMGMARTNYAELVVEAVRERMVPAGFRTGADGDELGDKEAWRIWQANSLDADSHLIFRSSLSMGMGYVIVGGVNEEIGAPLITPEDPREVIAVHDPIRRRKTRAALKVFSDPDLGIDRAFLYLPGFVLKASRKSSEGQTLNADGWEWDGEPEALPAPVVPVVAFPNRERIGHEGTGEFEPHLGLLDRINYTILNRLEIATMQAFRQRAVKGVPDRDEDGNEIDYDDIFAASPSALWVLPATADIWESGQVDLGPIRSAIRDDVQDLAAVTRTPLFYLTPDAANGSAEGASLAREGLVFKTQDRLLNAGESLEQVMALAFLFAGDSKRAKQNDTEVIWQSPERFSLAERYDAASKAASAGVPWRTVMSDILQFSPTQIARMETERATDALMTVPDDAGL